MVLDGAMMATVIILLTVAHPGLVLGAMWQAGKFKLGRPTRQDELLLEQRERTQPIPKEQARWQRLCHGGE